MFYSINRIRVSYLVVLLGIALVIVGAPRTASAACQPPGTTYGSDTMTVSVPSTTTYRFWVRIAPSSAANNSVMLQVDGGTCFSPGGSASLPANSWSWVNYQNGSSSQVMQAALTAGTHSLELIGTQQNVEVDSILLLADQACLPIGTGSNCTSSQPATPAPQSTTTSNGHSSPTSAAPKRNPLGSQNIISSGIPLNSTQTPVTLTKPLVITPTYVKGQTIKEVDYYLNSKEVYVATKPPYTYTVDPNKLVSGKYTLASKTIYTSGLSITAKETIRIKHSFLKNVSIMLINNIWQILIAIIIIVMLWVTSMKHRSLLRSALQRIRDKATRNDKGSIDPTNSQPPVIIQPQ